MADCSKIKASTSAEGGGGADAAHGLTYHRILAMIFILRLKLCRDNDPTFEYFIHLEKRDYGKFDDIVITYKIKGIWKELCIQCKHSSNKTTISASDFLIGNKSNKFALKSYISSYKNIVEKSDSQISERHFLLMNNRTIDLSSKYNSFTINENTFEEIALCENVLSESVFRFTKDTIENTSLCTEINGKLDEIDTVKKFLKDFAFVTTNDTKEFECDIKNILKKKLCKNDSNEAHHQYLKLYNFTDKNISQNGRISYKDVSKLFVPSNYKVSSLHFKVRDPNYLFTGRKDQLEILHSAIQEKKTGFIIDVSITGTSGIGKSQLTLQFIRKYNDEFKNIIWIDAESHISIENSFKDLAYECKLLDMGDKNINIKLLIKNIYSYLSKRGKSLIVFDDATQFNSDDNTKGICDYLPENTINENLFFIVTSQNRDWKTKNNIDLKVFSKIESSEFLLQTDIKNLGTEKELKLFCKILGNLPFALQTCLAYILNQNKMYLMFGQSGYFVSSFIKEFQINCKDIIHFNFDSCKKVLIAIWDKAILSILRYQIGPLAFLILGALSYFDSDGVPIKLLQKIVNVNDLSLVIKILSDYSLIDVHTNKIFMHKLLQVIVREKIEPQSRLKVIDFGFNILLTADPNEYYEIKTFIRIATKFFRSVFSAELYCDLLENLVDKIVQLCFTNGDFEQTVTISDELLNIQIKLFGATSLKVITSKILIIRKQNQIDNYQTNYLLEIEEIKNIIKFNNYDVPDYFDLIFNEIEASYYFATGKYVEAKDLIILSLKRHTKLNKIDINYIPILERTTDILRMCENTIMQNNELKYIKQCWHKIPKNNSTVTFAVEKNLAVLYSIEKKYDKALNILNSLLKNLLQMHGLQNSLTITCLVDIAELHIKMGNNDAALKILSQAREIINYSSCKEENLRSIELLACISFCYSKLQDYDNQEICAKLVIDYFSKNKNLEIKTIYFSTLQIVLEGYKNQGLWSKAYKVAKILFDLRMKAPDGLANLYTLKTLFDVIMILNNMKNLETIIYEISKNHKDLIQIYSLNNQYVLEIMSIYGITLYNVKKFQESLTVFKEILPFYVKKFDLEDNNTKLISALLINSTFILRHESLLKTIANVD